MVTRATCWTRPCDCARGGRSLTRDPVRYSGSRLFVDLACVRACVRADGRRYARVTARCAK